MLDPSEMAFFDPNLLIASTPLGQSDDDDPCHGHEHDHTNIHDDHDDDNNIFYHYNKD